MAELDREAEAFRLKWKARLGLSDREALKSYMRGAAADAAGYPQIDDSRRDQTYISVRVDGRGLDGAVDSPAIAGMVAEWGRHIAAEQPEDPRKFTKIAIIEAVGRNIHLDEEVEPLVCCADFWIAAQDRRVRITLKLGNVTLFVTFSFDDQHGHRRMQVELGYDPGVLSQATSAFSAPERACSRQTQTVEGPELGRLNWHMQRLPRYPELTRHCRKDRALTLVRFVCDQPVDMIRYSLSSLVKGMRFRRSVSQFPRYRCRCGCSGVESNDSLTPLKARSPRNPG